MSTLTIELMARQNNTPTIFELRGQQIKPCPFCGEDHIHLVEGEWEGYVWCCCTGCGVEGPVRGDRIHAVKAWQERK